MLDFLYAKKYKVNMKIFIIRDHAKCKAAHQTKNSDVFGAERVWMLGSKKKQNHIDNVVTAVTNGDEVGITHLWLLAEATGKTKARDQMCNAVELLLAKGCSITETSTGRTCTGGAELAAMIKDASNVLAHGNRGRGGKRGPAPKHIYTQDQAQAIADIWLRKDMQNDEMRIDELKRRGGIFAQVTVPAWYRQIKPMLASAGEKQ